MVKLLSAWADIEGDVSLNMTINELSTCHRSSIGVKVVVINNQWLGMVRQWQGMIYDGHRASSSLLDPGTIDEVQNIYPDFVTIAAGYRVAAERVSHSEDLRPVFQRMLANPEEPYLLDVIVDAEANVYPMIPAGGTYKDTIMSDDEHKPASDIQGNSI